jgi:hypothetical protein
MTDVRSVLKDMMRQRRVQAVTAVLAFAGFVLWLAGVPFSEYLAAAAIIIFAVATVKWIDDEEAIEEEQLKATSIKK